MVPPPCWCPKRCSCSPDSPAAGRCRKNRPCRFGSWDRRCCASTGGNDRCAGRNCQAGVNPCCCCTRKTRNHHRLPQDCRSNSRRSARIGAQRSPRNIRRPRPALPNPTSNRRRTSGRSQECLLRQNNDGNDTFTTATKIVC